MAVDVSWEVTAKPLEFIQLLGHHASNLKQEVRPENPSSGLEPIHPGSDPDVTGTDMPRSVRGFKWLS
jgi:hypothetical protein